MGAQSFARALVAASAAAALTLGLPATAHADQTVVVRGTEFPTAAAQLTYVGCGSLFERDQQVLQPYIGRGPGQAPSGARSLGYDLLGGTAIGAQYVVSSMASTTTASLDVFAAGGAQGLAVAGYQEPIDTGSALMWFGTAPVTASAGGWSTVKATPLSYTWTKYDMTTHTPVIPSIGISSGISSTVPAFIATHGGDGAGLYAIAFGCDGEPFSMDAMRVGSPGRVTTYDLEGLATSLTASTSKSVVEAGDEVILRGTLRSSTGGQVPSATVILERRFAPGDPWENVRVVSAGDQDAVARLAPAQSATYRWRFVDRPLAEGAVSEPIRVEVVPPDTETPTPTPDPTQNPTSTPTQTPTPTPMPTLPVPPTLTPTPDEPTSTPSPTQPLVVPDSPTVSPTASPTDDDEPSPSGPTASATP